jgi:hypothetical protein
LDAGRVCRCARVSGHPVHNQAFFQFLVYLSFAALILLGTDAFGATLGAPVADIRRLSETFSRGELKSLPMMEVKSLERY